MNHLTSLYPPRDRRRRRRWVTKKNVLLAAFALVLLFIGFSYAGELRGTKQGNFGRLYNAREREASVQAKTPQVVVEAPIPESPGADPMLLDSARRQQYLGVQTPPAGMQPESEVSPVLSAASSVEAPKAVPLFRQLKPGQRISITGGSDGLHLDVKGDYTNRSN